MLTIILEAVAGAAFGKFGAAIGAGSAYIFTRPFMGNVDVAISPTTFGDRAYGLTATIQF